MHWLTVPLLMLLCLAAHAWGATFPATSDPTMADQQRWGAMHHGYVADGCWHGTSATTSVALPSCRAFALDTTDPARLQGFEDTTPRTLAYSGGDGTYWLSGRATPNVTPPGWTCLPGLHYCTLKQETTPEVPSGLLLLGKVTVLTNTITAFVIQAPWRRTQPYTVPAGTTLTFGVCPLAEAMQVWHADGVTTGSVRFTPDACLAMRPEWWGADPTGTIDSTSVWRAALAASRHMAPLECAGDYLISATEPNQAFTFLGGEQIRGKRRMTNSGAPATNVRDCRFTFAGTGRAFGTTTGSEDKNNIRLHDLYLWDRDGTGALGLDLTWARTMTIEGVIVHGFTKGLWLGAGFYYGYIHGLKLHESREWCADISGAATNAVTIELGCNSTVTTMDGGVRLGGAPGMYGLSSDLKLRLVVEVRSGSPVSLGRSEGIDAQIYIEHPGAVADYSTLGAVQISRLAGGRIHLRMNGEATGGHVETGVRIFPTSATDTEHHTRTLRLTGAVKNYDVPLIVGPDAGSYGIDYSGVHFDVYPTGTQVGQWTGGVMLGPNLLTAGGPPVVDYGRASPIEGLTWQVGDVVWQGSAQLNNTLQIATTAGNPPVMQTLILPTVSSPTRVGTDPTPGVKVNQVYSTRLNLDGGAAAVTTFADGLPGQCLTVRALGNRTITDTATLELAGGAAFAMNAGDMLLVCLDDGVWREVSRSDNN